MFNLLKNKNKNEFQFDIDTQFIPYEFTEKCLYFKRKKNVQRK